MQQVLAARESGYRLSRVNTSWHKVSPLPSLISSLTSYTHLPKREFTQHLHCTHHKASLMVSRYTTLVPSLGLHTAPACEAGWYAKGVCAAPQEIERSAYSGSSMSVKLCSKTFAPDLSPELVKLSLSQMSQFSQSSGAVCMTPT